MDETDKPLGIIVWVLIAIAVVIGALAMIKPSVSAGLMQNSVKQEAYLEKNRGTYAKCDQSLPYSPAFDAPDFAPQVSRDTPADEAETIKQIHTDFENKINEKCLPLMAEYEKTLSEFKNSKRELHKTDQSILITKLGFDEPFDEEIFGRYEPGKYEMISDNGGVDGERIYTKLEIDMFYKGALGN